MAQKKLSVQLFALGQISNLTSLFRENGQLTLQHIMMALNLLVKGAYLGQANSEFQNNAQFKLFSLISQLQKFQLPGSSLRKGYCKDHELWIMRVNKLANKIVSERNDETGEDELDPSSVLAVHKANVKYVQKNLSHTRAQLEEELSGLGGKDKTEHSLALKKQAGQLQSLESLILSLNLLALLPQGNTGEKGVIETLEDIEELKECFSNLGLDQVPEHPRKKAKKTSSDNTAQVEAHGVLVDFLISQLTKPQSFLRDVANHCFKQFSLVSMDKEGLQRLLAIVATPNQEAG